MRIIVAGITCLTQYLSLLHESVDSTRPERCFHCGLSKPRCHGHYDRKADRENAHPDSLNPIPIQRFYCPNCKHTCSILPECIPPHRWYLWCVQQAVMVYLLSGMSLQSVAKHAQLSRSTCRRWWSHFKDRFLQHHDTLCAKVSELGRSVDFNAFWRCCLDKISLGHAMWVCHDTGVTIP
jgi:transposase-like protein